MKHFALSPDPIDPDVLRPGLRAGYPGTYLECQVFVPAEWEGRMVAGLDVEAVPELSEREGEALIEAILRRHHGVELALVCRGWEASLWATASLGSAWRVRALRRCAMPSTS